MKRPSTSLFVAVLAVSVIATLVALVRTVAAPTEHQATPTDKVVVVGVPSLSWDEVTATTMPSLWNAAEQGAVGLITTRSARSVTCPWDGWVTLGAGNRARYPATIPEDELPPEPDDPLPGEPKVAEPTETEPPTPEEQRQEQATEGCLGQRGAVPTVAGSKIGPAIAENKSLSFGAQPGALGEAVSCSTVVGPAPALAVSAAGADVRTAGAAVTREQWSTIIGECPLTLIATSHAYQRSNEQLGVLDAAIDEIIIGAQQQGATVIIAGISQAEYKRSRLQTVIVLNPGLQKQILSSPSTGRAPFSQLIDIAPTVLSILGDQRPTSMTGQVLTGQDRTESLTDVTAGFYHESVAASTHIWISSKFFALLTWLTLLSALALAALLWRKRGPNGWSRSIGTIVALLPAASLAANLYPWWSAARPSVAIVTSIAVSWALLSLIALVGPWRRYRSGPFLITCAVTTGLLAVDVLTGSNLQLNSPLGYDAIVAGRFIGFGNMTFAIFGAAALVLLAAACKLVDTRAKMTAIAASGGVALIVLDGVAGSDFGGVIALVPSLALLWLIVTRTRLSKMRLLIVFASGAVVVMAIAIADYLRPEQNQTHLGRFVGQILDGTAWTIVQRKLEANWRVLTGSVLTLLAIVLIAIVLWQWLTRNSAGRRYVAQRAPYAEAAVIAVATLSLLGFAVNDSGIAVTAAALTVIVPPLLGIVGDGTKGWALPMPQRSDVPSTSTTC